MITYYGTTISPNQLETGEGFLICRNVPIARTGMQKYKESEIEENGDDNKIVEVWRREEDVFEPATIASFEGKSVTNNHPSEIVTPENARFYERGHVQNVRRGSGEFKDNIVADLHIHDAELIKLIKDGKRQVSCGYEAVYEEKDGKTYQKEIRGNHVAIVDAGRAGSAVAIMDSIQPPEKAEREKMSKFTKMLNLFGLASKDKTAEEISKMALDTAEAFDEGGAVTEQEQSEVSEEVVDAPVNTVEQKLDVLIEMMKKLIPAETADEPTEEVTEEVTEETTEEAGETIDDALEKIGEAAVIESDKCKAFDSAMQAHVFKAVNEAVKGISNEDERQRVTDAIIGAVNANVGDIEKIVGAQGASVKHEVTTEDIQNAYNAMNPHYKKEA